MKRMSPLPQTLNEGNVRMPFQPDDEAPRRVGWMEHTLRQFQERFRLRGIPCSLQKPTDVDHNF